MGGYNWLKLISTASNIDFTSNAIDINRLSYDYLNSLDFFGNLSKLSQKKFNEKMTKYCSDISSKQCIENAVIAMLDNLNGGHIMFLNKYNEYLLERTKNDPKEYFNNSYLAFIDYILSPESYLKYGFKRNDDGGLFWNDKELIPRSNWQQLLEEFDRIKEKIKMDENLTIQEQFFFEEFIIFSIYSDLKLRKEEMPIIIKYFNKYPLDLKKDLGLTQNIDYEYYAVEWDSILAIQKKCNKIKNWILKFIIDLSYSLHDLSEEVDIIFLGFQHVEANGIKDNYGYTYYQSEKSTYSLEFYGMNLWQFWEIIRDGYRILNYLSQVYLLNHEVAHIIGGHKTCTIENTDEREKRIAQEESLIAHNRAFYMSNHDNFFQEIEADDAAITKLWLEYHDIFPRECSIIIDDIKNRHKSDVGIQFGKKVQEEYERISKRGS